MYIIISKLSGLCSVSWSAYSEWRSNLDKKFLLSGAMSLGSATLAPHIAEYISLPRQS